jgi:ribosomal protein S27AE
MPRIRSRPPCPSCGTAMFMTRELKACTWYCGFCGFSAGRYQLYSRSERGRHKREYNGWREQERRRRLEYVWEIKAATPCADCGRSFHPVAMDFDHTSDNKVANISTMVMRPGTHSMQALVAEIAKCEIVCSNCHRIRTHERQLL